MPNFMLDKCLGSRVKYDPEVHGPRDEGGRVTCDKCGRKLTPAYWGQAANTLPVHVPREPRRTGGGPLRLIPRTE